MSRALAFLALPALAMLVAACAAATTSGAPVSPEPPPGTAPMVEIPAAAPSPAPSVAPTAEAANEPANADAGAKSDSENYGMIGLLTTDDGGLGDSFGAGGLGLAGTGKGGGGKGDGIGLGNVGSLGHGGGQGSGQGIGSGAGSLGGAHAQKPPSMIAGAVTVAGRLPPEVIQRVARANFGRYRLCYENGLRTNPTLAGKILVKFVIDKDGAVTAAVDGGSDLPDKGVVACVVRAFAALSFPQPEGGVVAVQYPLRFSPGGDDDAKKP